MPNPEILRAARARAGLSQSQLAVRADVSQMTKYERGVVLPSERVARRLERLLNLAPGSLDTREPGRPTQNAGRSS